MALPLGEWGMESREGIKPSRAVLQTALLSENRLVERTAGIEPASSVWKTVVLPLNDVRMLVVPQAGVDRNCTKSTKWTEYSDDHAAQRSAPAPSVRETEILGH